jgi:hypothetical protein
MVREIQKKGFNESTENILVRSLQDLAEGLTGIAVAERKELALSIGHVFQKMRGGQFLSTFLEEWRKYKEKGRIKDDYQYTEQHKVCLSELLDFLDKDCPDAVRFEVLQKICLLAATESQTDRDSLLPQQYMKVARSLSSGELIVLNTCYRLSKDEKDWKVKYPSAGEWLKNVAEASKLGHTGLVELHENTLVDKHLLTPRTYSDRSGVALKPHYRLTDLGYGFCSYVDSFGDRQTPNGANQPTPNKVDTSHI